MGDIFQAKAHRASEGAMAQIAPEGETRTLVAVRDVQLECIIHRSAYASSSSKPSVAVVVLHPYSWLGGCMYDHVVQRLYSAFAGTRQYNTVLAYNSRGVGVSDVGFAPATTTTSTTTTGGVN